MITRALLCPELVGRRAELDELVARARDVGHGRGGIVLVEGDAGIGKSRLLDELRVRLRGGRMAIASGACYEFGAAPYQPFVELLDALGGSVALAGEQTQAEEFATVVERLAAVSAHRGTICLIEDVHWADEATLKLLSHLAARIGRLRVLLVLTTRSDELRRDPLLLAHIGKLTRLPATTRILLQPLDRAGVAQLVRLTLAGRATLPRALVDEIVTRSEGNPFFAEELLKNALERLSTDAPDSLPLAIRAMVADRLSRAGSNVRRLLALAAVIGRPFTPAFAARIAEAPEADVLSALRFGCESQMLLELRTEPVTYGFRHALTREAVSHDLLAAELRPLHRRIAEALEAEAPDHVADIGYHYWAARAPGKARRYNELAGQQAERANAFVDAVRFYERALETIDEPLEAAPVFAGIARCLAYSEPDRAWRIYEKAIGIYRDAGRMADAAALTYALVGAAHFAGDGPRALELTRSALAMLPADADYGEANGRTHIALCYAYMQGELGHIDAAAELLRDVTPSAAAATNVAVASMLENTRMRCALIAGDTDGVAAAAERYHEVVRRFGADDYDARAYLNVGSDAFAAGLDALAARELARAIPELHARRWTGYEGAACAIEAQRLLRGGDLAAARAMLERVLALPNEMSLGAADISTALLQVAGALAEDDLIERVLDPEILERTLRSGVVFSLGPLAGAYARWQIDRGERAVAHRVLEQALGVGDHPLAFGPAFVAAGLLGDRVLISRAQRAFERATPALAAALPVRAYRAFVDACANVPGAAPAARTAFEQLGWRYDAALIDEVEGRPDAAIAAYRAMGAVRDLRRLERTTPARGALSEREREVALLVAGGAANRTIARQLSVSEKTVEKHISSIYGKLGFSKRTELTAYMVRSSERSA